MGATVIDDPGGTGRNTRMKLTTELASPTIKTLIALVGPEIADTIIDLVREELRASADATLAPRWLTVERSAEYLGTTPKAIRGRIDRGSLPAIRNGNRVFVDRATLDATFAANRSRVSGT